MTDVKKNNPTLKNASAHAADAFVPSEQQMREAVAARDVNYDPVFLYGVITTGVFCLPSCAARPARPENLRFFLHGADALAAGLRECRRCEPLAAPARRAQLVAVARHIDAHPDDSQSLKALAADTDMSPSQLQKRFTALFGVSPKAYQDQRRVQVLKGSLEAGARITDAIQDAGYGSTSRVYGRAADNLGMTPGSYRAGGAGEVIYYAGCNTPIGSLLMGATRRGVCFAQPGDSQSALLAQLAAEFPNAVLTPSSAADSAPLQQWIDGLNDHLSRNLPRPDLPLDLRGTAFQIKVWKYLLSVPEGQVVSYSDVAQGIGKPKAVRAAASACGKNNIAVLIPCHRVLRGDGSMGGYRWGIERKRALLDAERAQRRDADG